MSNTPTCCAPHILIPIDDEVTLSDGVTRNASNDEGGPRLASNKTRQYPDPPPEVPGRFRYSIFVLTTYVGLGNCVFFCCLPLLAFEEIFRSMGYFRPASLVCAIAHVPVATCCCCPCVLCKVRKTFRKKRKIKGNPIVDFLLSLGLCFCVGAQLLSEARAILLEKKRGLNRK